MTELTYHQKWISEHPNHYLEYAKKNREKLNAYQVEYRKKNKEVLQQYHKKYNKEYQIKQLIV
jgi:predicted solute-binding protein